MSEALMSTENLLLAQDVCRRSPDIGYQAYINRGFPAPGLLIDEVLKLREVCTRGRAAEQELMAEVVELRKALADV